MFKRKFRLPKGIRFGNSNLISTPSLTIKTKENGLMLNRFSTIVSKKVDKRAVVRNKIRRIINSCMAELLDKLKQGYDMIIIVKTSAVGKSRGEFCRELNRGLNNLIIYG